MTGQDGVAAPSAGHEDPARMRHLAAIVVGARDAIISKDLAGNIVTWNHGATAVFGYLPAEAIGQPLARLFPPEGLGQGPAMMQRLGRDEPVAPFGASTLHKDGHQVEVWVTVSPVHGHLGAVVGASSVARDISERVRIESVLRATNERLERADDERRSFLNLVAHELRTPLTPLLMQVQMMRVAPPSPQELERNVAVMERNLRRLNGLVQQLLDVARMEEGRYAMHRAPTPMRNLVQEAVATFGEAARHAGVEVCVAGDAGHGDVDPDRVSQVLANLLSNALKFTPRGGRIEVGLRDDAGQVVVEVADDGPGLTPVQRKRLFQPFVQLHEGMPGTGLGLFISHAIARQHGGDLSEEGRPGTSGARFVLKVPRALAPGPADAAPPG